MARGLVRVGLVPVGPRWESARRKGSARRETEGDYWVARANVENTDRASAAWTDAVCAVAFAEEKAGGSGSASEKIKRNVKRLL